MSTTDALFAEFEAMELEPPPCRIIAADDRADTTSLLNDVNVIIRSYASGLIDLDMQHLHVMPGDYRSATSLFEHVMRELQRMQLSHVIVEMMPLIDTYIEYYSVISAED